MKTIARMYAAAILDQGTTLDVTARDNVDLCRRQFALSAKVAALPSHSPSETESVADSGDSNVDCDDIVMGKQTLSFLCPLSLRRLRYPAKGKQCTRRQIFDAVVLRRESFVWSGGTINRIDASPRFFCRCWRAKMPPKPTCVQDQRGSNAPYVDAS